MSLTYTHTYMHTHKHRTNRDLPLTYTRTHPHPTHPPTHTHTHTHHTNRDIPLTYTHTCTYTHTRTHTHTHTHSHTHSPPTLATYPLRMSPLSSLLSTKRQIFQLVPVGSAFTWEGGRDTRTTISSCRLIENHWTAAKFMMLYWQIDTWRERERELAWTRHSA